MIPMKKKVVRKQCNVNNRKKSNTYFNNNDRRSYQYSQLRLHIYDTVFVKAFANSRLTLPVDRPASTMLPISPNSPNNESIASISHFRLFSTTLSDEQQLP